MPKKKKTRSTYTEAYKRKIVARVLKGRASGTETILDIANSEGIYAGNINNWVSKAKANGGSPVKASGRGKARADKSTGGDLASVTSELQAAMGQVSKLKKRLRELLGDD